MRAYLQMFKGGVMKPWEELFQEATGFASRLGRERLINISHFQTGNVGLVMVWYWSDVGSAAGGRESKGGG